MIIEEGYQYLLNVVPSWILTGRIERVVVDACPELSYVEVSGCAWIERVSNHIDLMDADDPARVPGLLAHMYPGVRRIRLTAIVSADPVRALLDRSVRPG